MRERRTLSRNYLVRLVPVLIARVASHFAFVVEVLRVGTFRRRMAELHASKAESVDILVRHFSLGILLVVRI
jgi:hypothetical protein